VRHRARNQRGAVWPPWCLVADARSWLAHGGQRSAGWRAGRSGRSRCRPCVQECNAALPRHNVLSGLPRTMPCRHS
jgi:hypothetical protein